MSPPPKVRCRPIEESDLEAVADLLTQGFPARTRKYWTNALDRLAKLESPEGCPRFGYLLDVEGVLAGVLLLIFSKSGDGEAASIRCNVSSWYVDPRYRGYAAALVSSAVKLKQVTYLNVTPAEHTWPIIQAQGYRRYTDGQFAALPLLSRGVRGVRAHAFDRERDSDLPEYDLIRAHIDAGCLAVICETPEGRLPFLFMRRWLRVSPLGFVQLVYCRDTEDFVRCAAAIGRHLLAHGALCVICDAGEAVRGLVGRFFPNKAPRYFRGPTRPRLNDLAFTELVLFGP